MASLFSAFIWDAPIRTNIAQGWVLVIRETQEGEEKEDGALEDPSRMDILGRLCRSCHEQHM